MIRGAALKDTGHPKMTNVSFNHHVVLDPYDFLLWDTKGSFVKNFLFFPFIPSIKSINLYDIVDIWSQRTNGLLKDIL